jgi:carboxylesterase
MNNATGCLVIHGFAGSRSEVGPLCDYLAARGYVVSVPLLAGHEGTPRELARSGRRAWIEGANSALAELKKSCGRVVVIGFSMGGLIAVQLYAHSGFDALVLINTPVYYWDVRRILKNILRDFRLYSKKYLASGRGKPLMALLEFQRLLSATKPLFSGVGCATLVLQSADDDTVSPKSAEYISARLGGRGRLVGLPRGGHIVFRGESAGQACAAIGDFIKTADSGGCGM